MNRILKITTLLIDSRRNWRDVPILFLPFIVSLATLIFGYTMEKQIKADELTPLINIFIQMCFLAALLLISYDFSNGFTRRLLTNGLNRKWLFHYSLLYVLINSALQFMQIIIFIQLLKFMFEYSAPYLQFAYSLKMFLLIIMINFMSLFLSTLFKSSGKTVGFGYFILPLLFMTPANLLQKLVDANDVLSSPFSIYYQLSRNELFLEDWKINVAILSYCVLFYFLSSYRIKKMNF